MTTFFLVLKTNVNIIIVSQRPLMLGADIVMHSATKYMNGHSDVVMGLLICERKDLYDRLYFLQMGEDLSNFDLSI